MNKKLLLTLLILVIVLISGCDTDTFIVKKIDKDNCITKENVTMGCNYKCKSNIWQICRYAQAFPSGNYMCFCD